MKTLRTIAVVGALALAAGCQTEPRHIYIQNTGDPIADGKTAMAVGPVRDKVLWEYRVAATAMQRGQFDEAKTQLDDALLISGGIITKDSGARLARSYFHEESKKTFIGEPYERVMAYYYRGILYWMNGEVDNARACFLSAQIQDSDTEQKTYSADYALLDYLIGLADAKMSIDGADALKRAKEEAKLNTPPDIDAQANVLFFLEYGNGPSKYAGGQYGERLYFRDGGSRPRLASISIAGQTISSRPYDDLYYQATTRGGRVMDHVLANKAVFKNSTDAVGNVALVTGAILATDRRTQDAGLGLAAFGLLSKIVSSATTPKADTRMWNNLPKYLSFAAVKLPPGTYGAVVEFKDEGGNTLPGLTKNLNLDVKPAGQDTVVFISDKK